MDWRALLPQRRYWYFGSFLARGDNPGDIQYGYRLFAVKCPILSIRARTNLAIEHMQREAEQAGDYSILSLTRLR